MRSAAKLVLLALALPFVCAAQQTYRWVDEHGRVHVADALPPEAAHLDREVLNAQGVVIRRERGALTPAQREEQERREAQAAAERAERDRRVEQDRALLRIYSSVEDIEELRDRRIEQLDQQIKTTEDYLESLYARRAALQEDLERFDSEEAIAARIPKRIEADLTQTEQSIDTYEDSLARLRTDRDERFRAFESDIARFRELKGL